MQRNDISRDLFEQAKEHLVGGVNSPVRAFKSVGGTPVFFRRGEGPYLWSEDGERYIDYVGSWGPMILGHGHPQVTAAVQEAVARGLSFGAPTVAETQLARKVQELVPSLELLRLTSSGTEATLSAIRLARAFTGRDTIVKFEGCYHGHSDSLLIKAGSGALTLGVPSSPGVVPALARYTLTLEYNNAEQVRAAFRERGGEIAAVIVEPVAGNMNMILPEPGFLETLREVCDEYGALLIFDEVMTGFRVYRGGAQALYGIRPDLTTLGKVIGGGMPVGALGGRRDVMQQLAPDGPVYQAGTLSGNPVAMAAGLATLEALSADGFYASLEARTRQLTDGLRAAAADASIPLSVRALGGMFGFFFTAQDPVRYYSEVVACDQEAFRRFYHAMLQRGVYLAPSAFEAGFVSAAHGDDEIEATLRAARDAFDELRAN